MAPEPLKHSHWHWRVQEYYGQKLFFIFIRYRRASILFKQSILDDINRAQLVNYEIYELYSNKWDLLIKPWCSEEVLNRLMGFFGSNTDLDVTDVFRVQRLIYIDKDKQFASPSDIDLVLFNTDVSFLQEIQDSEWTAGSELSPLTEAGVIVQDQPVFDSGKIQFYIIVSSLRPFHSSSIERLIGRVASTHLITNKCCYQIEGSTIQLILKGQTSDYYAIHTFLTDVTHCLEPDDPTTQTVLVANQNPRISNKADFRRGEEAVIRREIEADFPEYWTLPYRERVELEAMYLSIRTLRAIDSHGILTTLLRVRVTGQPLLLKQKQYFFTDLEPSFRRSIPRILRRLYGEEWAENIERIKQAEGITRKKIDDMQLGDLCKVIKALVLEKRFIDITLLTDREFKDVMDEVVSVRNVFVHQGVEGKSWEEILELARKFIPIWARLCEYISSLEPSPKGT